MESQSCHPDDTSPVSGACPASRASLFSSWWQGPEVFVLVLLALVTHFFRLDALSIRGEESHRYAIGREMLETGDWIVPRVQGEAVYFRPPLQNWLIAVSGWLRGGWDGWSIRLPGALAVLATTLLIFFYCRHFLTPLGAFGAAAAFATMLQVMELGRLAETESLFALLVSGALMLWFLGYRRNWPDRRTWMLAYFVAGLGMLAKGTQAPIYLAAGTGLFLWWTGQWRRIFTLAHLAGLAVFCLVFAAWFVPYFLEMGPAAGKNILLGETAMHVNDPTAPSFFRHLYRFPLETFGCMLPGSILLLGYFSGTLRRSLGPARLMVVFSVACVLATYPSCWLVRGAVSRYWMPMYPLVAPLIGLVMERGATAATGTRGRQVWLSLAIFTGLVMLAGAVAALAMAWPFLAGRYSQPLLPALGFAAAAGILGVVVLLFQPKTPGRRNLLAIAAPALVLGLANSICFVNIQGARSLDMASAVASVKQALPANAHLVSYGRVYHRFAFFYGDPIPNLPLPRNAAEYPPPGTFFCFTSRIVSVNLPQNFPFQWQKVAEVICDRYPLARPENIVVVGQVK